VEVVQPLSSPIQLKSAHPHRLARLSEPFHSMFGRVWMRRIGVAPVERLVLRRGFFGSGWAAEQKLLEQEGASLEEAAAKLKAEQREGLARMAKLQVGEARRTSADRSASGSVHAHCRSRAAPPVGFLGSARRLCSLCCAGGFVTNVGLTWTCERRRSRHSAFVETPGSQLGT